MKAIIMRLAALLLCAGTALPVAADDGASKHRVRIEGEGAATVVFEAGLGDTLDVWSKVQPRVASDCARTVSYNRAGYPGSSKADTARDAATVVAELRAELEERGLAPPYLLVGHSLGGLYVQYFARNYPGEVAGLVLVDSTHWDQLERIRREAPAMYGTVRVASLLMFGTMRKEFADSNLVGEQVHASPAAVAIPTVVLSSTRAAPGETPAFRALMWRMQTEIAKEYSAVRHDFVGGSGHYIQRDQPGSVVKAIRKMAGCSS
jgi:pimeloyl-ACP methyl ester carboxylesterase